MTAHCLNLLLPGMNTLQVQRISRVQATQRAGRAGRTAPGKCIRLYGQNEFELMDTETVPEIQRSHLEDVVLFLKDLHIDDVLNVDFLDPPDKIGVIQACKQLYLLGALDAAGKLTSQGRSMAKVPVEPALARALLAGAAAGVLSEVVTIVAMLGCEEMGGVFIRPGDPRTRKLADESRLSFAKDGHGDQIALLRCYASWDELGRRSRTWCDKNWVHGRSLARAAEMRDLLLRSLSSVGIDVNRAGARDRISFCEKVLDRTRQALCYGLYM